MSLRPTSPDVIPASTAAVARAAFPHGSSYLRLRDALGTIFTDHQFASLFASRGRPAECPWRLALVEFRRRMVEPDHRRIKRRTRPMLGFGSFWTARRALAGVEAMARLANGQVRAVPANAVPAQRAFVHQVFGRAA